jgi:hypothetical protein
MSKSNPENTKKPRTKPEATGSKPGNTVKAKPVKAAGAEKPASSQQKEKAKAQNKTMSVAQAENTEHPAPEINSLPTAIAEPPTEQKMEVHHHPDLEHKPKPWKEYLLEGFMIFIAVMMGFIAENIRETITNNEHVKQLTLRLVQDLKVDTRQLDEIYTGEMQIKKNNDMLFGLLQQPLAKANTKSIQQYIVGSHDLWPFHPLTVSIAAIKNELYLKQFSDSEIISYISRYEGHIELLNTVQDITLKYQRSFLDPFLLAHFTPLNLEAAFNQPSVQTAQMRNLTQEDLTQLATSIVLVRINTNELIRDNRQLKTDALNLLRYVTKQYHLAD